MKTLECLYKGDVSLEELKPLKGNCLSESVMDKIHVLIRLGLVSGLLVEMRSNLALTDRGTSILIATHQLNNQGILIDIHVGV